MNKLEYLKMIQAVITRMAGNSFLIKGWCVTLVSAILALAAKEPNKIFIGIAFYPVLMFWILDGYFLYQERLYRALYGYVAENLKVDSEGMSTNTLPGMPTPYSMDTILFQENPPPEQVTDEMRSIQINKKYSWRETTFSPTLQLFYFTMTGAVAIIFAISFFLRA